jgi:protoheme IX farnesyltransferase
LLRPRLVLVDLISLTKPRVTALVVLTTASGLFLGGGASAAVTLPTLALTALVVGAANALNCWLERDSDRRMARTACRPLPAGRLDPDLALGFGLALGVVAVAGLTLAVNATAALLAALALLAYVLVYTPMKRSSPDALLVGAVPGALPPIIGWTAATGGVAVGGVLLGAVLFLWQLPHFIAIALLRKEEYAAAGLRTLPVVLGVGPTRRRAVLYAGALVPVSLVLGVVLGAGAVYLTVAVVLGGAFLAVAIAGLRDDPRRRWARRLFLASLAHLPLLLAALALDR